MPHKKLIEILLLSSLIYGYPLSINGQELNNGLPIATAESVIDGNALSNVHGRVTVNMAAGDANRQVNAGALAINQDGGLASALTTSHPINTKIVAAQTPYSINLFKNALRMNNCKNEKRMKLQERTTACVCHQLPRYVPQISRRQTLPNTRHYNTSAIQTFCKTAPRSKPIFGK